MKNPFGCDTVTQKKPPPKLECESKSSLISTTNEKFVKGPTTDCDYYCGELFSGPKEKRNFYKHLKMHLKKLLSRKRNIIGPKRSIVCFAKFIEDFRLENLKKKL